MHPAFSTLIATALSAAVPAGAAIDFARDVYPVLRRACFECHGPEVAKGGLRVHSEATLTAGGKSGAVVKAGDPDHSELLRRVALPRTDKEAMPRRGVPLTPAEMGALREWVRSGAVWPVAVESARHWSYVPPVRPALPAVKEGAWAANEVDHFVLAKLEEKGTGPSREAEPAVLFRRLSLDLTGLPPSIPDVDGFVKAYRAAPTAAARQQVIERAVDRLLASKEFGVRWARPWLDLARYADSHGFQRDDLREIWGYRDWVVDALNADMPFDQFTIEQVAGDLLPDAKPSQIVATGFHRCTPTNVEAGTEPEESRINQVIDRVNTTGAVWLGSTLECAQCHNHKYDPFSQRDYYSLLAYFNNTEKEAERANQDVPGSIKFNGSPFVMKPDGREAELAKLEARISDIEARIAAHQSAARKTKPAAAAKGQVQPLRPVTLSSTASAPYEFRPDYSVVFSGTTPDRDTCTLEAELPAGEVTGVLIEALTDPSLPGEGPGRGEASRPNFVLQQVEAALAPGSKKGAHQRLTFAEAYASFSQSNFPVDGLLEDDPQTGWAIKPMFHKPHWAALVLDKPLQVEAGAKLSLKLVQHYGGGRVIGRLRVSAIQGDVPSCLPKAYEEETAKPASVKRGRQPADPVVAALTREKNALQRQLDAQKPPSTEVMKELAQPRMTAIFKRGVYTDPADPVTAGIPAIFGGQAEGPANRLTLAKWLVSRENPLTARVTVNRWWHELFGRGLVATPEDFGIKGIPPTHPELLDWLAVEFMDSGWSMKVLLKKIVTSATYRQSSSIYEPLGGGPGPHAAVALDPENTLLWHGARHRMDAEMIRDNALRIAGLLDVKQGGPPIRPPQPDGLWTKVGGQNYKYEVSPGSEQHRRGLYVVLKRGAPYPSFVNFDASARMACIVKRGRSNTPLQALTLLNDPVYVEAARALVRRISVEVPESDPNLRLGHAFRLALARPPRTEELRVLRELFDAQKEASDEAGAWFAVAAAILNLDETITKS